MVGGMFLYGCDHHIAARGRPLAMTRLLAPTVTALPRRYMSRTRCNVVILLWAAALLAPVSGGWVNLTVSTSEAVL